MKLFYEPESGRMGDIIPFYEDGIYRLFYLGKGWQSIATQNQLDFSDPRPTGIHGGTGSVVKADGIYHMFYCKFASHPYNRQFVCHATSPDLRDWTEHPEHTFQPDDVIYEMSDWRDPHVIRNEEEGCWWMLVAAQKKGRTMRKGCVGLCKSADLVRWEYCEPLYAPAVNQSALECPDLFRWGDWWYLTYSSYTDRFTAQYRMSRSPCGPWTAPATDTFDSRCFYAPKHGTNGKEHYMYGWNPRRDMNIWNFNPPAYPGKDYNTWDWGGTMIVHRLVQNADGTLGVCPPEAVDSAFPVRETVSFEPLTGSWQLTADAAAADSPCGYASLLMNRIPKRCRLEMKAVFTRTPREFGVALQVDRDFAMGYYLIFEPNRHRVQYKTGLRMYEDGGKMFPYEVEQERPFEWEAGREYRIRIFVDETVLVLYADDQLALSTRMFDRSGLQFGLFVSDGSAQFRDIRLYTENTEDGEN
ncbi:MAG: DUF4975 domain-containing protein [Clostridia bacterium]|nr:DUF4975 domain-containing protein [Clostridia bacterium]